MSRQSLRQQRRLIVAADALSPREERHRHERRRREAGCPQEVEQQVRHRRGQNGLMLVLELVDQLARAALENEGRAEPVERRPRSLTSTHSSSRSSVASRRRNAAARRCGSEARQSRAKKGLQAAADGAARREEQVDCLPPGVAQYRADVMMFLGF